MGRYSTEPAGPPPQGSGHSCGMPPGYAQQQVPHSGGWPTSFPKPVIGLDLNGLLIDDTVLMGPQSIRVLPGVLDAVRIMRQKGHKVFILSDQPSISKGLNTAQNVDSAFQELMKQFGQAGIFSIDGFLYNTSDMKDDEFAKPNLGMVKRAENEVLRTMASKGDDEALRGVRFKDGWYVGDSFVDLKFADKIGSTPVLVKTGNYKQALEQLDKFTYKDIKEKTKVFNSLLDFANSLA